MDTIVNSYYIFCSSTYRGINDSTTDYTLQISQRIEPPKMDQYMRLTLESFTCLNEIPSVSAANNTIYCNGIVYYLDVGNCKIGDLVTWFNGTMPGLTAAYSSVTNAFTITGSGNLTLVGATASLFGFPDDSTFTTFPVTSTQPVRLRQTNQLVLSVNNLPSSAINLSCLTSACCPTNILGIIPIEVFPAGLINFQNMSNSYSIDLRNTALFELSFLVTDIYGNSVVSMPEHTFTLRVDIVQAVSREIECKLDRILETLRLMFLMKSLRMNPYLQTVTEDAQNFVND